jgi:hypothetical protein
MACSALVFPWGEADIAPELTGEVTLIGKPVGHGDAGDRRTGNAEVTRGDFYPATPDEYSYRASVVGAEGTREVSRVHSCLTSQVRQRRDPVGGVLEQLVHSPQPHGWILIPEAAFSQSCHPDDQFQRQRGRGEYRVAVRMIEFVRQTSCQAFGSCVTKEPLRREQQFVRREEIRFEVERFDNDLRGAVLTENVVMTLEPRLDEY